MSGRTLLGYVLVVSVAGLMIAIWTHFLGRVDFFLFGALYEWIGFESHTEEYIWIRGPAFFIVVQLLYFYFQMRFNNVSPTELKYGHVLYGIGAAAFYFIVAEWSWILLGRHFIAVIIGPLAIAKLLDVFSPIKVKWNQMSEESLLEYCRKRGRICPQPYKWTKLYEMLPGRRLGGAGWEPPAQLPLVLTDWFDSSDEEKANRLTDHIKWAVEHNALDRVSDFLTSLQGSEWHYGDGIYANGVRPDSPTTTPPEPKG